MLPKINPATTAAWKALKEHFSQMKNVHMRELFQNDTDRFSQYSITTRDIVFDYSKNIINDQTLQLLIQLANECRLKDGIDAMFNGEKINETEGRAVLHTALRNLSSEPVFAEGKDVMPDVRKVLKQMKNFCKRVHDGGWRGYSGKRIKYIVNIGIGGSDLGPLMVTEALKPYWLEDIQTYFVSNVDGTHIAETLKKIKPERTLFLIASKTFTTQETMTNAFTAR
ncbi:MAG TPA: glucose-6-phosphate isomerase, partial [Chitinophagaceae bacterium]|nr:glucose-6-phosphate isomerase [Chitinophagaceae bacterium]